MLKPCSAGGRPSIGTSTARIPARRRALTKPTKVTTRANEGTAAADPWRSSPNMDASINQPLAAYAASSITSRSKVQHQQRREKSHRQKPCASQVIGARVLFMATRVLGKWQHTKRCG